jgi:hypothetical protein
VTVRRPELPLEVDPHLGQRCLYADLDRCTAPCESNDESAYAEQGTLPICAPPLRTPDDRDATDDERTGFLRWLLR